MKESYFDDLIDEGASLDFGAATHLGATCFPRLPGYQNQPRMHISPRKHLLPPPSGVLPYAIRILGIFPCGTISAEQRMRGISREEGDVECKTV